jgi:hypothetical protein
MAFSNISILILSFFLFTNAFKLFTRLGLFIRVLMIGMTVILHQMGAPHVISIIAQDVAIFQIIVASILVDEKVPCKNRLLVLPYAPCYI